jgi:hypothetical protein
MPARIGVPPPVKVGHTGLIYRRDGRWRPFNITFVDLILSDKSTAPAV